MSMGWAGAIIATIGLIMSIYKAFIDPVRKEKKKAVEDGKIAVDKRDKSAITAAFTKLKRKK